MGYDSSALYCFGCCCDFDEFLLEMCYLVQNGASNGVELTMIPLYGSYYHLKFQVTSHHRHHTTIDYANSEGPYRVVGTSRSFRFVNEDGDVVDDDGPAECYGGYRNCCNDVRGDEDDIHQYCTLTVNAFPPFHLDHDDGEVHHRTVPNCCGTDYGGGSPVGPFRYHRYGTP